MKRRRDLLVTNAVALALLLVVLLLGWREEAAVGLVVLVVMDALVLVRERTPRPAGDERQTGEEKQEQ